MVKIIIALLMLTSFSYADEYVNGYMRRDGTYVQGYYRSSPNSTVTDNYSYKGNYNPYTGETGTRTYAEYSHPHSFGISDRRLGSFNNN